MSADADEVRRVFSDEPISEEQLTRIFEVLAKANSSYSAISTADMMRLTREADCCSPDGIVDIEKFVSWIFDGRTPVEEPPLSPLPLLRDITGQSHTKFDVDSQSGFMKLAPTFLKRETSIGIGEAPRLLRGKTGHDRGDMVAIANLAADALDKFGWEGVDRDEIEVQDKSGHGGSKTFKVSAPGRFAVALHSRDSSMTSDKVSEPRTESAAATLAKYGCAPRRLAYGGDWFIERWEGKPVGNPISRHDLGRPPQLLTLVSQDSPDKCIFEHAADIKSKAVPMTLSSHPGKAVCVVGPRIEALTGSANRNDLYAMMIGDVRDAVSLKCAGKKGELLAREGWVLDIDCWKVDSEGVNMWLLNEIRDNAEQDMTEDKDDQRGRYFTINDDGTITVTNSEKKLVLGVTDVPYAAATLRELASLLADIHRIPTDWFDQWREKLCEMYPALKAASHGSMLWWYTTRQDLVKGHSEESMSKWLAAEPVPFTKAGSKIVTNHGDFHMGNIIRTESGLKGIDLEGSCVAYALFDLAWAFCLWCVDNAERRGFAQCYLEEMGYESGPDDLDLFLLDIETFRLNIIFGDDNLWGEVNTLKQNPAAECSLTAGFCAISAEARGDATLRAEILEKGLRRCARALEVKTIIKEREGDYRTNVPVTIAPVRDQPSQLFSLCKDGTLLPSSPGGIGENLAVGTVGDGKAVLLFSCSPDCLKFDTSKVPGSALFEQLPPAHYALGEKFLIRVDAGKALSWKESEELATKTGGVLPTIAQLKEVGAKAEDHADVWIPCLTEDGESDWVQLSNRHHPLYKSHKDYGPPGWGENSEAHAWRKPYFYIVSEKKPETAPTAASPALDPGPFRLVLANDPSKGLVQLDESGVSFALGLGPSEKAISVMADGEYLRHDGRGLNVGHLRK